MMMKKTIRLLTLGVLLNAGVYAQSVEDGVKAFYNGNYEMAISVLEKQTDDPEAAYWLAKSYFEQKNQNEKATAVVDKALAAHPENYLLLAAKGQSLLLQNKVAEARKRFDAAIDEAGRKEEDQARALNAVGNAVTEVFNNVDKIGDIQYAVKTLEAAKAAILDVKERKRDMRLVAAIYTNLAEASLKATPGDGSRAFSLYLDALTAYPSFAKAEYNKAKIFKSQRNTEMYLDALQKTLVANPNYLPALNDLYEYNGFTAGSMEAAKPYGEKIVSLLPPSPNNEYFRGATLYFNQEYDAAIKIGKEIIAKAGAQTKPETYKLVAYSLVGKKDTAAAIPYVDDYFKYQVKDEIRPLDYALKATAYSAMPGKEEEVVKTYMQAAALDTTIAGKINILEQGAKTFASSGKNMLAGDLYAKILEIKPEDKLTINDYYNAGYTGYYKAGQYERAWKIFDAARTKFPDLSYGYMLAYESSSKFDTINAQNILIPDAEKYIAYLQSPKDTTELSKKRATVFGIAVKLFTYYANVKKDNANTLKYLHIGYNNADDSTAKEQVAGYIKSMGGTPGAESYTTTGGAATDSTGTPPPPPAPASTDSTKAPEEEDPK